MTQVPDEIRVWREDDGTARANIEHSIVYHSPDGFNFGYYGSGPADLALNILALYTSRENAEIYHQEFKKEFIATMPEEGGSIKAETIRAWINDKITNPKRRIGINPSEVVPITVGCYGCDGTNDLCMPIIREVVETGKVAFMIYSDHVREKVEDIGYKVKGKMQRDILVGMYIYKE